MWCDVRKLLYGRTKKQLLCSKKRIVFQFYYEVCLDKNTQDDKEFYALSNGIISFMKSIWFRKIIFKKLKNRQ